MNSETIALPHGYTAVIAQDDCPSNPFDTFDCEPPIAVFYDRDMRSPGGKAPEIDLADLFHMIPAARFRTAKGREKIADAAGIDLSDVEAPEPGNRNSDTWKDAMAEALPESPHGWRSAIDYFDCMEAVAGLLGIPCYNGQSNGYSQGDSARVFVAATPEWREKVGVTLENAAEQCRGTFDLYSAWAWGDCYGVSEILRPDGSEVPDGSVWGFYGSDHEKSGILEHCRDCVVRDRKDRAERAAERRAYLRTERAARMDAACRDIATV